MISKIINWIKSLLCCKTSRNVTFESILNEEVKIEPTFDDNISKTYKKMKTKKTKKNASKN